VREVSKWQGTATELLTDLDNRRYGALAPRGWPETAQAMGGRVTRAAPLLRASGISVSRNRGTGSKRTRIIELAQVGEKPSDMSESSGCPENRPAETPRGTGDSDMSDMSDDDSHIRATGDGPIVDRCPSCGGNKPLDWSVCGDCRLRAEADTRAGMQEAAV